MKRRRVNFNEAMGMFHREEEPSSRSDEPPPETVSQLAGRIKGTLESLGTDVRVRGEVSNFVDKGHWYFSLKDAEAVIGCAMWQSDAARARFHPAEGDEIVVRGQVSFYGKQGRTQLYVRRIERLGVGSLQERFEALCRELRELGYFDESRKWRLPAFPRRIAVVTSATGAVIHDIQRTALHRCPAVAILHVDVRVQGDGAADDIAHAIVRLDRASRRLGIDAIVVARGGGSLEDLWAFNERVVADAIFRRSRVPIVAAIGHESDTTIAELVADRRASTPTQAAMLLVPDREELREQLSLLARRGRSIVRLESARAAERLRLVAARPVLSSPRASLVPAHRRVLELDRAMRHAGASAVAAERQRLTEVGGEFLRWRPEVRLEAAGETLRHLRRHARVAASAAVARARERCESAAGRLAALAPERVLARGYSYTRRLDGTLVRRVADAPTGSVIETVLVDGALRSRVEADASGPGPNVSRPAAPKGSHAMRREPRSEDRGSLFGAEG